MILAKIVGFLSWAVRHIKESAILVLLVVLGLQGWLYNRNLKKIAQMNVQIEGLEKDLKQKVEVKGNKVIIKYRDKEGRVVYIDRFLPPEGGVTVKQSSDSAKTDEVIIRDRGWCFRVGGGGVYDFSEKPRPNIDVKFAYFKRLSGAVGFDTKVVGLEATYHIDQVIPKLQFNNLEFGLKYGWEYDGLKPNLSMLIRSNF